MLSDIGLITYIGFIQNNNQLMREYAVERAEVAAMIAAGTLVLSAVALDIELRRRFEVIFDEYFDRGVRASKGLVSSEVVRLADATKIPFKYNRDVIDLLNERSVFKGFADTLYKEGFKKGEIDRIKKFLLQSTYNKTDEAEVAAQLQKSYNLTRRRAQLLARDETSRLVEETKLMHHDQPEVKEVFDLVWQSKDDAVVRRSHREMHGKVRQPDGFFHSDTFGLVKAPPLEYNCRCSVQYRRK